MGEEANGVQASMAEHVGDGDQVGAAAMRVVAKVWRPTWAVMCSSSRLASAAMARMMSQSPRTDSSHCERGQGPDRRLGAADTHTALSTERAQIIPICAP